MSLELNWNNKSETTYTLRNDNVLLRVTHKTKVRGIMVPEISKEGKECRVIAIGPDVRDLKLGDLVMLQGTKDDVFFEVPGASDLIVVRERCVVLTYEVKEEAVEDEAPAEDHPSGK